jgi:hypothetical protein
MGMVVLQRESGVGRGTAQCRGLAMGAGSPNIEDCHRGYEAVALMRVESASQWLPRIAHEPCGPVTDA